MLADRRIWPMFLFRALSLQGTYPTVMVALEQHSKSFTEPSVRAENTLAYTYRIYFAENVADSARELREMHRPITGLDHEGRRFHAWNRDVWTWVHLTTIESLIYAIEVCFGPRPAPEVGPSTGRAAGSACCSGLVSRTCRTTWQVFAPTSTGGSPTSSRCRPEPGGCSNSSTNRT
ncbi:oxygenase MpaB family protein [Rhodococcus sp. AB351]|uniref:oxygenase MpaB family protein n=1 Tax=Rhodococcus TaxID=1827 RepID=UPI0011A0ED40|nr:oxygenase MpaB family protein [Rhodococcus rhodochrous]